MRPLDQPALARPAPVKPADCPVEDWLAFLGHRWNALVLWHLQDGPKRHGRLLELLPGITPKVLSERLVGLEGRGLVAREEVASFPRAVRYALTARGGGIVAILDRIEEWAGSDQPGRPGCSDSAGTASAASSARIRSSMR